MRINILLICIIILGTDSLLSMSSNSIQQDPWPVPSKYKKMTNPYVDTDDSDKIGKDLYYQHCRSCHGTKGLGDGKKAGELATPVGDITTSEFKSQSDGEMYYKTYIGREDMPGFEKKVRDEEDQWLLINYIRKL